ncbi:uncharacterized protein LOC62_02G003302 [Vanrija pseudolonga]|uniref:Uncharacterized protein n=1 Tax=Vanrija pseudolonga TaxID=143232 RepID=A0AAF0Y8P7_9TREE|nr:hypothetical protein LOC62_02G003302 [Vanrija pseudolonga]
MKSHRPSLSQVAKAAAANSGSISSYVSMGTDSTRSIYATQGSASSKSSRGSNRSGRSKASSGSRGSRAGASGRLATTIPEDAAVGAAGVLALGASAAAVYHARRSRNNTDETDIAVPRTSAAGSATPPAGIPRSLEAAGPSGDIGEFGTRIFIRQPTGESEADHPVPSSIGRPSFSERNTSVGTFGTPVEEDSRGSSDYPNFPVFARGRTSISSLPATSSVPEDNSPMGSITSLQTHAGYLAPAISAGAAAAGVGAVAAGAAAARHGGSQPGDSPTRSTSALVVPTGGIRRESTPSHLVPGAVPIDPGSGALLSPFGQVGVGQLATPQTAGSGGSSSDHGRRPAPRQHPLAVPAKRSSGQSEGKRASGQTDKSDPAAPIAPARVAPALGPGTHIQQRQMSRSVGDLINTSASAPVSAHDSSLSSGEATGGGRPRVAVLDEFGVVHESASRSAPLLSRTLWSTGNSGNSGQSTGTSALGSLGSVSEYVRGRISKPEMVELPPSRQTSAGNSSGSDPPRVERPLPPLPTLPADPTGSPSTPRATLAPAFRRVGGRRGMAEGEEALLRPPRPEDDDDDDDTPRRQAGWSPKWFKWSPNKRG